MLVVKASVHTPCPVFRVRAIAVAEAGGSAVPDGYSGHARCRLVKARESERTGDQVPGGQLVTGIYIRESERRPLLEFAFSGHGRAAGKVLLF